MSIVVPGIVVGSLDKIALWIMSVEVIGQPNLINLINQFNLSYLAPTYDRHIDKNSCLETKSIKLNKLVSSEMIVDENANES